MRFSVLLPLLALLVSGCGRSLYTSQALDAQALHQHKTVAILPFDVRIETVKMADLTIGGVVPTPEEVERMVNDAYAGTDLTAAQIEQRKQAAIASRELRQRLISYQMQQAVQEQLQRQRGHRYSVAFQEVLETNRRLQKAGITYDNLPDHTMQELQSALGVDAIFSGQVTLYQSLPKPIAAAMSVMTNVGIPPSHIAANLTIHDCNNGKLVWKFDQQVVGNLGAKPGTLAKALVHNSAHGFPYQLTNN
ncbi:hypothetical protein [Hymenobacter sp. BT491]|uniref:hypothetical protein n=1 Tax=Hymenobacter sp. BT491 TaxID=2766779 RepID=UPI001653E355|nr:hypothetical protein [Hymenobacter sp. BT491]MBC6991050.1 hypothetical protein [Hymenobacter sp. BT491]